MANDFSKKTQLYTRKLDELAERASVTSDLDGQNSDMVRDAGSAGSILLPKLTIDGLGNYDREIGFPKGDASIDWQAYTLRYDRGREFSIDDMDNAETLETMSLNMFGKFVRDFVVPEMDAVRLSTYASNAGTTVAKTITAEKDALKAVLEAEAAIEDKADLDAQRKRIRRVAVLTLLFRVLGSVLDVMGEKVQFDPAREVGYGREVLEHLAYSPFEEVVVRRLLYLDEVGHVDDFVHLRETAPFGVSVFYLADLTFSHIFSLTHCFYNKNSPAAAKISHGFG